MDIFSLLHLEEQEPVASREYENITLLASVAEKKNTLIFYFTCGSQENGISEYFIEDTGNGNCHVFAENGKERHWDAEVSKSQVVPALEKILQPAKEWKESYEDFTAASDGYSWELTFFSSNGKIGSVGYEDYPEDYEKVCEQIKELLEQLNGVSG